MDPKRAGCLCSPEELGEAARVRPRGALLCGGEKPEPRTQEARAGYRASPDWAIVLAPHL